MSFHTIDLENYPRRAHFDYFRSLAYPYVGLTAEVDAAPVLRYAGRSGQSFFLCFLHAVALAADAVPEFRQRIRDGAIVEYTECPTSHTEPLPDGSYRYCTIHHRMSPGQYFPLARKARNDCRSRGLEEDADVESMYFVSSLPWLRYSALVQPVAGGDESNPRFTWGRYEKQADGRVLLPVSVLAHHALVDGLHIARFYDALGQEIAKFDTL